MKYYLKIRTSGNRTSGDRTSGGPPVLVSDFQRSVWSAPSEAPPWLTTHAVDIKKSRGAFNQRHLQHILKVVCNPFFNS